MERCLFSWPSMGVSVQRIWAVRSWTLGNDATNTTALKRVLPDVSKEISFFHLFSGSVEPQPLKIPKYPKWKLLCNQKNWNSVSLGLLDNATRGVRCRLDNNRESRPESPEWRCTGWKHPVPNWCSWPGFFGGSFSPPRLQGWNGRRATGTRCFNTCCQVWRSLQYLCYVELSTWNATVPRCKDFSSTVWLGK